VGADKDMAENKWKICGRVSAGLINKRGKKDSDE
jgi:hypothetical protein